MQKFLPDGISALDTEGVGVIGGQQLGQVAGNQGACILISPQPEMEAWVQVDAGLSCSAPALRNIRCFPGLMD